MDQSCSFKELKANLFWIGALQQQSNAGSCISFIISKNSNTTHIHAGTGEMARCLSALAGLPDNQGLFPSIHMMSQLSVSIVPGDPVPASGLCMLVVYIHTRG